MLVFYVFCLFVLQDRTLATSATKKGTWLEIVPVLREEEVDLAAEVVAVFLVCKLRRNVICSIFLTLSLVFILSLLVFLCHCVFVC